MTQARPLSFLGAVAGKRTLFPAWLGVLLLSFGWLPALHIYTAQARNYAAWFVAGALLLVLGCRGGDPGPRRLSVLESLVLGLAAIAGIVFLPRPFDIGPMLLAGCAALALVPIPDGLRRWLLPGLWVTGVVLVLQAAFVPVLYIVAARLHDAPFMTPFLYYPLKLVAPETIRAGSVLHMMSPTDWTTLTPSCEKLGLVPGGLLAVGCLTLVLLHPRGTSRLAGFLGLGLLFAWSRLLVLLLIVARFRVSEIFWTFDALFLSFLALPVLLGAWWSFWDGEAPAPAAAGAARGFHGRAVVGAALLVAGFTFFWGYQDPGTRKQGRILIDESHSDWEWTTQLFDKEWYGSRSGYNYYCLADYWNHFYHVETRREPLTPASLLQWDVLFIKTPTSAYAPAEVDAIVDFVRRGGGLYLIGDHTNVFGSSTYLNPIAERFGLYFRYDATYVLDTMALSLWRPPALLPHAVVRHMGDFLFATSCSLDAPLLSENVILGYGLRGMYLDYSETSYFPTKAGKMDYDFPLLVQAAGVRCGKGRVLGFTDSTTLSNFFMFIPGKPELAMGSIEWLNRTNRHGFLLRLALVVGFAGLGLLLWELRRAPRLHAYNALVAAGLLTFVVVAKGCERAAARAYALPQPARALEEVVFDGEHGNFLLPVTTLVGDHWSNMHTFYVWTQRLGLVPRLASSLQDDALQRPGRVLVEVNPNREYTTAEIDGIVEYVRRGGTLLVLDTPENAGSVANQVLGPFQMSFTPKPYAKVAVTRPKPPAGDWLQGPVPGDTLGVVAQARGLNGATTTLLVLPGGAPVMGWRSFGNGKVVAFGVSRLFSTEVMGSTAVEPTPRMRAVYQAEYDIFERIAGIRVADRYTARPTPGSLSQSR